jgi:hypothetical protein
MTSIAFIHPSTHPAVLIADARMHAPESRTPMRNGDMSSDFLENPP